MSTPSPSSLAIAVDIGGTFTDIALHDAASGRIWRAKTPSVPSDPSQAFLTGIRLALEDAGKAADCALAQSPGRRRSYLRRVGSVR